MYKFLKGSLVVLMITFVTLIAMLTVTVYGKGMDMTAENRPTVVGEEMYEEFIQITEAIEIEEVLFVEENEALSEITFSGEFIHEDGLLTFLLFTPSSAEYEKDIPVVFWLHGSGECGVSEKTYRSKFIPKMLDNWKFDGFNAYVVCPILTSGGSWNCERDANRIMEIINYMKENYSIDENNISITGASLGGLGTQYMVAKMPDVFSRAVVLSGYPCNADIKDITVPIIGFVGHPNYGEDSGSYSYMTNRFKKEFGKAQTIVMNSSHGSLPYDVFNLDENNDNKSDIFMWLIGES